MLNNSIFWTANAVGLVAFALVGASKAIREGFDPFGVSVVGLVTAFGGGTTRDILLVQIPLSLQTLSNIGFGMTGILMAVLLSLTLEIPDQHPSSIVADAIGLGAFATAGAIVATDVGVSPFGVVAIATINAAGGGAFADILLDRSPFILLQDFYASCAVLGGFSYWLVSMTIGDGNFAASSCAVVTFGTRLAAIRYEWELPNLREHSYSKYN
ncbi:trimeric intracellular cation channel family protein [Halocatena marina]|uniref:trimeric intracellular cation channel family protein n=1 Tax=Halocatena marina TaxID=2934937 RepID=UPI0020105660|nr:trimeric intracellular cation channel family protein [Halocatena marina]